MKTNTFQTISCCHKYTLERRSRWWKQSPLLLLFDYSFLQSRAVIIWPITRMVTSSSVGNKWIWAPRASQCSRFMLGDKYTLYEYSKRNSPALFLLPVHSDNCHSLSPGKSNRELSCQPKSLSLMLPHVQRLPLSLSLGCLSPYKLLRTARYRRICVVLLGLCGHTVRRDMSDQTDNPDTQ